MNEWARSIWGKGVLVLKTGINLKEAKSRMESMERRALGAGWGGEATKQALQ